MATMTKALHLPTRTIRFIRALDPEPRLPPADGPGPNARRYVKGFTSQTGRKRRIPLTQMSQQTVTTPYPMCRLERLQYQKPTLI